MIYTPQVIVGGADRLVGSEGGAVAAAVARHADQPLQVRLTLSRDAEGRLVIQAEAVAPPSVRCVSTLCATFPRRP